ncbi:MAG: NADP-dependent isocitrate dehydrogenase [Cyclobacteriaceae bacterium]|nr:NADP-dependent isocitrate dehydrogenase [Cyclobacteriaceae bacterium]MCH8517474.1 NADP-dependent isocitrate dehydrogenase [Cyclobacteriaceae bacterium]
MNTSEALKESLSKKSNTINIVVAKGDGIGPEIMDATLDLLKAANVDFNPDFIEVGEKVYKSGNTAGITDASWESIHKHKIILKAPITTPQGKGYKSLNVTMRKSLGLFANVRPVKSLHPFVTTLHPKMDVVVVRENEEDLYAGIEHRQTDEVYQCLKLITRPGSEKIIRYAFEYAKKHHRKKVTCLVKDNIMKLTDGLFHQVFREISAEYPDIQSEVQIIDIGSARMANQPQQYDVVVTSNLYGDIVSDIVAEISGSVGLAGSSNIGTDYAMFEAIHGSAPDISGMGIANPSGLMQGAIQMLNYLGLTEKAALIQNAWLKTIEDGIHTADIYNEATSKTKANTKEFTAAVIERLGQVPSTFPQINATDVDQRRLKIEISKPKPQTKTLVGVDIFLDSRDRNANTLGDRLTEASKEILKLKMITNRGVKVYPDGMDSTFCTDHWRCRFVNNETVVEAGKTEHVPITPSDIIKLMSKLHADDFDVIKTENLYEFDGKIGFSLGQGE